MQTKKGKKMKISKDGDLTIYMTKTGDMIRESMAAK
jgi:hypothetical protein